MLVPALLAAAAAAASLDAEPLWMWLLVPTGVAAAVLWLQIGLIVAAGGLAHLVPPRQARTVTLVRHIARHFAWTAETLHLLDATRELDALERGLAALERRIATFRDVDASLADWRELASRWFALASGKSEAVARLGGLPREPDLALGRGLLPPHVNLSSRDLRVASGFLAEKHHLDRLRHEYRTWLSATIDRIDPMAHANRAE